MPILTLAFLIAATLQGGSAYTLAGQVRDSEGKPAAGVGVAAYISHSVGTRQPLGFGTRTDSEGKFTIRVNRPGKYIVIYNPRDDVYTAPYLEFFRNPNNPPPEVVLSDDAPHAQVAVFMSKNGRLKGIAIDSQTQLPIDNLVFRMCRTDRPACWRTDAKSARGMFSIPTAFTPFTLHISSPDYEDWFGLTGTDPRAPVVVPAGAETEVRIVMNRRRASSNLALNDEEKIPEFNLPAPKQILPEDNQVFDIFPRHTTLTWEPVEGAASYSVEVDVCQPPEGSDPCPHPQTLRNPAQPSMVKLTTTSYEFKFVGAQPGRWRVWAVDQDGRAGFKSPWKTFVYRR